MKTPPITLLSDKTARRSFMLRAMLTLLVMLAPLITALAMTLPRGVNLFSAIPRWNDENWWFAQYAGISRFGHPLGYFGYEGTHASRGTWGPWGMYPVLLTGGFARVFGWGLHAFVYYNFLFLALSALTFVLLTKPSVRGLVCLAVSNALAYIAVCYALICMNEVVRYSMALVLAGVMLRLIRFPDVSRARFILRCTLVPLLLIYATAFYAILGAFIPVYLYLMLRRLKPVWRVLIAAAVSVAAIHYIHDMNAYTVAPYITNASSKYNGVLPDTLAFKLQNYFYGIVENTHKIDPFYLLTAGWDSDEYPLLLWFCALVYALIGVLIWRLIVNAKKPEKREVFQAELMCLFLIAAFLGGHIVMYSTGDWTFMRGCYAAVYCSVMVLAVSPKEDAQPWRAAFILSLTGLFTFASIFVSQFSSYSRFSTEAKDARWNAERAALEEVIRLDKTADPWANTVVLCGTNDDIYLVLPYGVGVNGAIDEVINENAKYVVVGHEYSDEERRDARVRMLRENGHEIVYETEDYAVFVNTAKFG